MTLSLPRSQRTPVTKTFPRTSSEPFAAYDAARNWLVARGYSLGAMQRGAPTCLMLGGYKISKWRNLTPMQRYQCHGVIRCAGSFRDDAVTVCLFDPPPSIRTEIEQDAWLDALAQPSARRLDAAKTDF